MIAGDDARAAFDALLALMERQAAAIAEAHALSARMSRGADERRWRRPDLLWPQFTKRL